MDFSFEVIWMDPRRRRQLARASKLQGPLAFWNVVKRVQVEDEL